MMRASVDKEKAAWVLEGTIEADGPAWDLYDLTATWRTEDQRRWFRPDHFRVTAIKEANGESAPVWVVNSINISGQRILKGGRVATNDQSRDSMTWRASGWISRAALDKAPEWVRELATQSLVGITAYTWTDAERAEEVQPL
jgi:hypothetical protein